MIPTVVRRYDMPAEIVLVASERLDPTTGIIFPSANRNVLAEALSALCENVCCSEITAENEAERIPKTVNVAFRTVFVTFRIKGKPETFPTKDDASWTDVSGTTTFEAICDNTPSIMAVPCDETEADNPFPPIAYSIATEYSDASSKILIRSIA